MASDYQRGGHLGEEASRVSGFGPGTSILTDRGDVPVEWLDTSYRVLTRDNGYQPLLRVWRTRVAPPSGAAEGGAGPVRLPAGALGDGRPLQDLFVTANMPIFIRAPRAVRLYGLAEVLVPAQAWAELGRAESCIAAQGWSVTHVACTSFEVILAQGAWVQSSRFEPETAEGAPWATAVRRAGQMVRETSDPVLARPMVARHAAKDLIENSRESGAARWPNAVIKRA